MRHLVYSFLAFASSFHSPTQETASESSTPRPAASSKACTLLAKSLQAKVATPLSWQYLKMNEHWATSSSEESECSVGPKSTEDIITLFQVINETRSPWAVKGGGHAYNAGFSSTSGVQISMSNFKNVVYQASTSTVKIGAGNIWDEVYAQLEPHGVNVVGGRVPGVGVAGLTLGGGYSWLSQQYGLTIDTVVSYDLVTPTGHALTVTEDSDPDIFFALKGGGNNFGIVTAFTLKTFPQGPVWGGTLIYLGDLPSIRKAIVEFEANNNDPKAAILVTYTYTVITLEVVIFLFYDGPRPPPGLFDAFLHAQAIIKLKNVKTRSYANFVSSLNLTPKTTRVVGHTIPIAKYTMPVIREIIKQTFTLGRENLLPALDFVTALSIEPFLSTTYTHSLGGAYPHTPENPWSPFEMLVMYVNPLADSSVKALVRRAANDIQRVAVQEGQSTFDAIVYNNYALADTNLTLLYGDNLQRLRLLRSQLDPYNLLSLTGGWKL